MKDVIDYHFTNNFQKNRFFIFRQKRYSYLVHKHNYAWKNERAVEVPIVWSEVKKTKGNILEIGNVLSYYFSINHDVVDKYEKALGVINEDVTTYNPKKKYDLIVAISTLEHVGWDEKPREPLKILKALNNLKSLLTKNGRMIITLPIGYHNLQLNLLIERSLLGFSKSYYLKRVSRDNRWVESSIGDVKKVEYNRPFPNSNAIFVGFFTKS